MFMWKAIILNVILYMCGVIWIVQMMVSTTFLLSNAFLTRAAQMHSMLNPFPQGPEYYSTDLRAHIYFVQITACLIDLPLVMRIVAVFPSCITPRCTRIPIIGIAVMLMIARFVANILFAHNIIRNISTQLWRQNVFVGQVPFCTLHLALKLVDNL
jgi:hypothetical protein